MKCLPLAYCLILGYHGFTQNHADCDSAYWIGTNYLSHFVYAYGEGNNLDEASFEPCFLNGDRYGQAERNSVWISFGIDQPGTLRFAITPDSLGDDYDFVLYRIPEQGGCKQKVSVRCMAAGDADPRSPCMGATGLRDKEKDESEDAGCADRGDNAWLKPLPVKSGERYVLLVSNMTHAYNGFRIRFTGDFTFLEKPE